MVGFVCIDNIQKQIPTTNEMRAGRRREEEGGDRDLLSKANEVLMVRVHVGQLNVYQKHDL